MQKSDGWCTMKRILAVITLLACLGLCACGKDKIKLPEKITYYDNLSVVGLAVNAEEELTVPTVFVDISPEVLQNAGGIRLDLCKSYVAKKADGGKLDEYGILQCKNEKSVNDLYKSIQDYVNTRKNDESTLSHYEDADTVRNGAVACYGNYVVYTFLSSDNTAFQSCVEGLLRQ